MVAARDSFLQELRAWCTCGDLLQYPSGLQTNNNLFGPAGSRRKSHVLFPGGRGGRRGKKQPLRNHSQTMNSYVSVMGGLRPLPVINCITDILRMCFSTNIRSELRFARHRTHNKAANSSGAPTDIPHQAARHIHGEIHGWYNHSKVQVFNEYKN